MIVYIFFFVKWPTLITWSWYERDIQLLFLWKNILTYWYLKGILVYILTLLKGANRMPTLPFFRGSDPIQGEETGRKIDEKTKGIVEEQYSPLDLKGVFPSEHAKMERVPPGEPTLFWGRNPKQKSRHVLFWRWNQSWFVAVEVGGSCFVVRSSEDIACRAKREVRKLSGTTCRERDSWLLICLFPTRFLLRLEILYSNLKFQQPDHPQSFLDRKWKKSAGGNLGEYSTHVSFRIQRYPAILLSFRCCWPFPPRHFFRSQLETTTWPMGVAPGPWCTLI